MDNVIIISVTCILGIITALVGLRNVRIHYNNPLPKFENGDKRIGNVKLSKTRVISSSKDKH